jgi:hypothetical protein
MQGREKKNSDIPEIFEKKMQDLEVRLTNNMKTSDRIQLDRIIEGLEEVNKKITTESVKTTFIELVDTLKKI